MKRTGACMESRFESESENSRDHSARGAVGTRAASTMSPRWSLKQPGHVDKTAASNVRRVVASASDVHLQELAASDIRIRMRKMEAKTRVADLMSGRTNHATLAVRQRKMAQGRAWRAHREASSSPSNAEVARRRSHSALHSQTAAAIAFGGAGGALRFAHVQHRGRAAGAQPWPTPRCRRISCGGACAGC